MLAVLGLRHLEPISPQDAAGHHPDCSRFIDHESISHWAFYLGTLHFKAAKLWLCRSLAATFLDSDYPSALVQERLPE
jgi:hypothetical protein